ncbi:membrane dipeptidase, partial [Cylindrospermopsis raciborskii CS-506_C]
ADWLLKAENAWKMKVAELQDTAAADKYYSETWLKQNPEPFVSVAEIADHFDYIRKLIGVDYIGIGSDLGDKYEFTIKGMADVSCFPLLLTELARRGWTKKELKKIISENFLRVFDEVEKKKY